jgi:hypothetical protein
MNFAIYGHKIGVARWSSFENQFAVVAAGIRVAGARAKD